MDRIEFILGEICLFLNSFEVFIQLSTINKNFKEIINTEAYKSYWIQKKLGITLVLNFSDIEKIYHNTKKNKLLHFSAWKTDGGISQNEIYNRYENMWEYNGSTYSSYYHHISDLPLKANISCLASFAGGYQSKKDFKSSFHNDFYQQNYFTHAIPNKYHIENYCQKTTLVLDPLSKANYNSFEELSISYFQSNSFFEQSEVFESFYELEMKTADEVPVVTKIAVARPFFFTGAVKTLIILACEEYKNVEFSDFNLFNNVADVESAENISEVIRKNVDSDDVKFIEYKAKAGIYPLVWIQFQRDDFNHTVIQLSSAHYPRVVCAKLIDIDDRRMDYGLQFEQPNFDITYVLFIGGTFRL